MKFETTKKYFYGLFVGIGRNLLRELFFISEKVNGVIENGNEMLLEIKRFK